jgi:hypothetical protein
MDHRLIQSWLQLPPGDWPPDHYTLLGLEPGAVDPARIEHQVHERMQRLRSYQLTHPDLATEAMNRLARALVCLTDAEAKKAYDREQSSETKATASEAANTPQMAAQNTANLPSTQPSVLAGSAGLESKPSEAGDAAASREAVARFPEEHTLSDWQSTPPPPRQPRELPRSASSEPMNQEVAESFIFPGLGGGGTTIDTSSIPSSETTNPALGEHLRAAFSRRGLRSKAGLYYQVTRTRQLLWTWEQLGKYLSRPTRFVNRPTEATDLIHHMGVIRELLPCELLPSATPLLGEAGQPGYLVLALARQQMIVPMLQTLLPSQREALARDWQAGHGLLRSVRQFLREELRIARRRRGWRHVLRLMGTGLRDHPGIVLLLVAWASLNVAFATRPPEWCPWWPWWPQQLICLLALLGIKLAYWLYSSQPIHIPPVPDPERKRRSPRKRTLAEHQPNSSRA